MNQFLVTFSLCVHFPQHFTAVNKDEINCLSEGRAINGHIFSLNLKWKWEAIITVFNITIIPWWPFISHSLGTLVEAGLLKVTEAFVFLFVWKGDFSSLWPPQRSALCAHFAMLFFLFSFSAVSGCLTVQEQAPNLPCLHRKRFHRLLWFLGGISI